MLNKKYCEPYMIAAFLIIVILGTLYTGTAKINLQYVRGVEISRADILIRSELLMLRSSIMYIVLLLVLRGQSVMIFYTVIYYSIKKERQYGIIR